MDGLAWQKHAFYMHTTWSESRKFATHVMRRERQGRQDPELTIEPK